MKILRNAKVFDDPETSIAKFFQEREEKERIEKLKRIEHSVRNYALFCMYSAEILLKKSEDERFTEEERKDFNKRSGDLLRISGDIMCILKLDCLEYEQLTREEVQAMWERNYNQQPNPFAEIPPEYKKNPN